MIKFDKNEFLKPQIYSTNDSYETRCIVNNEITDDIKQLQQENKELQERIDKAIEYIRIYRSYQKINNRDYLKGRDETGCLDICQVDELLDILKEVEK